MKEVDVKRLITIGSIGAHTHSAYPFMRIKAQMDDIVEASGLDYTVLESSAVYGAGDGLTETIALALRRFPFFFPVPGDGRARLQPLHVDDLAKCILACIANDKTGRKTYIVGGPQQMTYDEMINIIMQATHHTRRKRYLPPASAARWSNFMRGFIGGRTLYTATQLDLLSIDRTTNLDAVSFQFNFTPVRMANTLDYLR
jgi:NADH dehydrogenase